MRASKLKLFAVIGSCPEEHWAPGGTCAPCADRHGPGKLQRLCSLLLQGEALATVHRHMSGTAQSCTAPTSPHALLTRCTCCCASNPMQGEAVVKVYGNMSGIAKLASKVCSPGTPMKFDDSTKELTSLAKQVR